MKQINCFLILIGALLYAGCRSMGSGGAVTGEALNCNLTLAQPGPPETREAGALPLNCNLTLAQPEPPETGEAGALPLRFPLPQLRLPCPAVVYQRASYPDRNEPGGIKGFPVPVAALEIPLNDPSFSPPRLDYSLFYPKKSASPDRPAPPAKRDLPAKSESLPVDKPPPKLQAQPAKQKLEEQPGEDALNTVARDEPKRQETHREIYARKEDRLEIGLVGKDWVFLGSTAGDPDRYTGAGVVFISRESEKDRTSFTFKANDFGEYILKFQLQDNTQGKIREQKVCLKVVTDKDFESFIEGKSGQLAERSDSTTPFAHAEQLLAMEELESALVEFIKDYREGSPYLNDRIAAIYSRTGRHEAAVKYYRRNLEAAGEYADRAVLGLIRSALALEDPVLLLDQLQSFLDLDPILIEQDLVAIARFQLKSGHYSAALNLFDEYLKRYLAGPAADSSAYLDEVYFLIAQAFEQDCPQRDLKKARDFYQSVYDEFPESSFARRSYQRIRYLDRYFFHIR